MKNHNFCRSEKLRIIIYGVDGSRTLVDSCVGQPKSACVVCTRQERLQ